MLKLKPNPTFTEAVKFTAPGGEVVSFRMVFKHYGKKEFIALQNEVRDLAEQDKPLEDADFILRIASDWQEVDAAFTRENLAEFLDNYAEAARAIGMVFAEALSGNRRGN